MTRQITTGYGAPSTPALEQRIRVLEVRVAALTEALQILAAKLEAATLDEPGDGTVAGAAPDAHALLIASSAHR
ncbi:hypothetical protein ACGFNU_44540 [Spirillospora sp. NPDC048911]|uniref:hypothetical protein n=1 Tax=Spirillospora sp. NPDC048911 TaxID=3364527 RepID=UPI003721A5EE